MVSEQIKFVVSHYYAVWTPEGAINHQQPSRDYIVCFVASYLVDMLLSASMQVSRFLQIQNTSKSFPPLLSAVLHVSTRLIVSRLGWRSSFLLQRFLTRGAVPYFLIYLFIYFQKEKC